MSETSKGEAQVPPLERAMALAARIDLKLEELVVSHCASIDSGSKLADSAYCESNLLERYFSLHRIAAPKLLPGNPYLYFVKARDLRGFIHLSFQESRRRTEVEARFRPQLLECIRYIRETRDSSTPYDRGVFKAFLHHFLVRDVKNWFSVGGGLERRALHGEFKVK